MLREMSQTERQRQHDLAGVLNLKKLTTRKRGYWQPGPGGNGEMLVEIIHFQIKGSGNTCMHIMATAAHDDV